VTFFEEEWPPWNRFQARIKAAISRASDEHETVRDLLTDLRMCEMFLRSPDKSLEEFDSPAANELRAAMETHAAEDPVRYDEVCAANVVLASMNGIVDAAMEGDE
jgi:hypothetical protein